MKPDEAARRELVSEWLARADEDLGAARSLLRMRQRYLGIVCFLSQQAVEKSLKGLLTWRQVEFPRTHDLRELVNLVANIAPELSQSLRSVVSLTRYSVQVRYPEAPFAVTRDEAMEAARHAARTCRLIRSFLRDHGWKPLSRRRSSAP